MRRRTRASWRWVDTRPGPTNKVRIAETHVITQMQINTASRDFPLVAQFIHYAFQFFTLNLCRFRHRAVVELLAGTPRGPSGRHSDLRPEAGGRPRKRARRNGAQRQRQGGGQQDRQGRQPNVSLQDKTVCFHLARPFYEVVRAGRKATEYRANSRHWRPRLEGATHCVFHFGGFAVLQALVRI